MPLIETLTVSARITTSLSQRLDAIDQSPNSLGQHFNTLEPISTILKRIWVTSYSVLMPLIDVLTVSASAPIHLSKISTTSVSVSVLTLLTKI
jgi:hypothetical protein